MRYFTTKIYYKVLRKWEDNVVASLEGKSREYSTVTNGCEFCRLSNINRTNQDTGACWTCPISTDTALKFCGGTPYYSTGYNKPKQNWEEFQYLLNLAYANGMESLYMDEI